MFRRIGFREDDDRLRAAFPGECELRSMRPRSTSPSSAVTMPTTSTFAASACDSARPETAARMIAVRRGTRSTTVPSATVTQSPVHRSNRPERTRNWSLDVMASQMPRSTRVMRAGVESCVKLSELRTPAAPSAAPDSGKVRKH